MTNIADFLMENVKPADDVKKVELERFNSPFEVVAITEKENSNLKKACTNVRIAKGGRKVSDLDTDKYTDELLVRCVKSPDLHNAQLQESYETQGSASETLKAMLLSGEYADLSTAVLEINGFDDDKEEELVEEVKN